MNVYSFLGRSTGILGHNSINIGSRDESNGESFGGQLSELTVRGRDFSIDARIVSSGYKR